MNLATSSIGQSPYKAWHRKCYRLWPSKSYAKPLLEGYLKARKSAQRPLRPGQASDILMAA